MNTHRTFSGATYRQGRFSPGQRQLAEEVAVAISYNGSSHAVLMATPDNLEDLVRGFSWTEGLVTSLTQIEEINRVDSKRGIDMQVQLVADVAEKLAQRRRAIAGPVGCGLCGIESLDMAMRDIKPVSASLSLAPIQVGQAVKSLSRAQLLNLQTRAVHAAGWFSPQHGLVTLREDVGRHNALDKLIGALLADGTDVSAGAIVMTSRLSIELVQKAAIVGCGMVISVSAPTAVAVEEAEAANMTLVCRVRDDEFEISTHPERVVGGN
ncbi:formate dehydrogenase accessory sulfurtransferase FdhD [Sulfitobacter sp. S45]|uniref:formate dehydrogenase accessory sulfurtransferase FdhD n=1 Tax=Sulfitobacter sp. S45 TaxID=3368581 RepID=UPI0037469FDF